jgi:hypothetical protein
MTGRPRASLSAPKPVTATAAELSPSTLRNVGVSSLVRRVGPKRSSSIDADRSLAANTSGWGGRRWIGTRREYLRSWHQVRVVGLHAARCRRWRAGAHGQDDEVVRRMIVFTALAGDVATVARGKAKRRWGADRPRNRAKRAVALQPLEAPIGATRAARAKPRFGAQERPAAYLLPSASTFTEATELSS